MIASQMTASLFTACVDSPDTARKPSLSLAEGKKGTRSGLVVGQDAEATCEAPVGYTDAGLTWVLESRDATAVWFISQAGLLTLMPGPWPKSRSSSGPGPSSGFTCGRITHREGKS